MNGAVTADRTLPRIAVVFDGPFLPTGSGAAHRILTSARLLSSLGFPVTVINIWRGLSDPELLAAEPFESILCHPSDVYGASPAFIRLLRDEGFEIIQTKTPSVLAALIRSGGLAPGLRTVFECHDLPPDGGEELPASRIADQVIALSPHEAQRLRRLVDSPVAYLPCYVPDSEIRPRLHTDKATRIALLGNMFYEPNAQSVRLLGGRVLGWVREEIPDAQLHVIGPFPPTLSASLDQPQSVWHGHCADPVETLRACDVAVSVVATGTGVRMKMLHYLAAGLPVVANRTGIGGLPSAERAVSLAEKPREISRRLIDLLADPQARGDMAAAGLAALREAHTGQALARSYLDVYAQPFTQRRPVDGRALDAITAGPPHWIRELLDKGTAAVSDPALVAPGRSLRVAGRAAAAAGCRS